MGLILFNTVGAPEPERHVYDVPACPVAGFERAKFTT
jgi:hypothetical protein